MANGPVSYNHNKLDKPMDVYPTNMKLIGVYEETTLSPSATKNCHGCVSPIAFFASRELFSAIHANHGDRRGITLDGKRIVGWRASEYNNSHDMGELADPKTKFALYVSGHSGKTSMMKYNGRWWIVFGSDKKRKMRRITLHVPVVEFSTEPLDKAEADFLDFIRGTIRGEA